MKQFLKFFAAPVAAAILSGVIVAWAAQTNYLGTVFIADTTTPTQQLKVNSDGSINVNAGSGGTPITNYALETGGNLASILSAVQGAIPAGSAIIGKVGIDQTTPGTTNLVQEPDGLAFSGTCTTCTANSTAIVASIDTLGLGFQSVSMQFTTFTSGTVVQIQGSEDNSNWVILSCSSQFGPASSNALNFTQASAYCPALKRYIRAEVTAWSSGTNTVTGYFRRAAAPQNAINSYVTPYPNASSAYNTAIAINGNATGTTGAVVGSLAAASNKYTYICGFNVTAIGGTAAIGPIVIAGTITASQTYYLNSSATGVVLQQTFTPCIQSSSTNTAITVTTTADGTASNVAVNSWGFQL